MISGYLTAREAAKRFGFEYSYFTRLLKAGEIPSAIKWSGIWLVPDNVEVEKLSPGRKKANA